MTDHEPMHPDLSGLGGTCQRCDGCGKIDDGEGLPWKYWAELPLQSSTAVLIGLVKPLTCPGCGGSGKVKR